MKIEIKDKNGVLLKTSGTYCAENIEVVPVVEDITVTPSTEAQVETPSEGYCGIGQVNIGAVTPDIDANIVPENIKEGVSILGVVGTLKEGSAPTLFAPVVSATGVNGLTWENNSKNGGFAVSISATIDGVEQTAPINVTEEMNNKILIVTANAENFTSSTTTVELQYIDLSQATTKVDFSNVDYGTSVYATLYARPVESNQVKYISDSGDVSLGVNSYEKIPLGTIGENGILEYDQAIAFRWLPETSAFIRLSYYELRLSDSFVAAGTTYNMTGKSVRVTGSAALLVNGEVVASQENTQPSSFTYAAPTNYSATGPLQFSYGYNVVVTSIS